MKIFQTKMNQNCSIPLLEKDEEKESSAKNLSFDPIDIINGNEYQLRFNCSTVELKCKVYSVLFINNFFSNNYYVFYSI
jgi:hypothetical protein